MFTNKHTSQSSLNNRSNNKLECTETIHTGKYQVCETTCVGPHGQDRQTFLQVYHVMSPTYTTQHNMQFFHT